jgi:hypothetical protein
MVGEQWIWKHWEAIFFNRGLDIDEKVFDKISNNFDFKHGSGNDGGSEMEIWKLGN